MGKKGLPQTRLRRRASLLTRKVTQRNRRGIPTMSFATASPAKETGRDTSDKARAKMSGLGPTKDGKIQNSEENLTHGTPGRRVTHWLMDLHEHVPTVPTIPKGMISSDTPLRFLDQRGAITRSKMVEPIFVCQRRKVIRV